MIPTEYLATATMIAIAMVSPNFAPSAEEETGKGDEAKVETVVRSMNEAFGKRDIPGILSTFEEGAAKVSLFKAHGPKHGPNDSESQITHADLRETWSTMFGILFGVTKSYERKVTDITVHADGDIAVAWASMTSVLVPSDGGAPPRKAILRSAYPSKVRRQVEDCRDFKQPPRLS